MTESDTAPATDRDLLQAFADRRDEAAFTTLVGRHGPLVYGVCRRVLGDQPDADDAFQATFLVLARRPGAVGRPERLGNWLYGVALRCARRARASAAARRAKERPMPDLPAPPTDPDWADVRPVLDEEIGALPDKLRAALVLCELEGLDRDEAAAALGVPAGTVSSRLARAKEALRGRLARRGVALTAVGVGVVLARAAPAAVPQELAAAATAAGVGSAGAGAAAAGLASLEVQAMLWTKVLRVGLAAAVLAAGGVGAAVGYRQLAAAEDKKSDTDLILGEWKITAAKKDGQGPPDAEQIIGQKMTILADKIQFIHDVAYKLDPSKNPKQIDITPLDGADGDKGKVHPGIYKLDGDKLVIHFAQPEGERPTDFESKEGAKTMLVELERVKK